MHCTRGFDARTRCQDAHAAAPPAGVASCSLLMAATDRRERGTSLSGFPPTSATRTRRLLSGSAITGARCAYQLS
eukprot:349632-Chlamydomonas_euryale.AAC.60